MRLEPFFLSLLILLSGCSIYESKGRKDFEDKAPDELVDGQSLCWTQPESQALWHVDSHNPLTVQKTSETDIQVCFQQQDKTASE